MTSVVVIGSVDARALGSRKPAPDVRQGIFRQDRHAIVSLLTVGFDVVAETLEFLAREFLVDRLDLLEADDVGHGRLEPGKDSRKAGVDGVDVPGGDAHAADANA